MTRTGKGRETQSESGVPKKTMLKWGALAHNSLGRRQTSSVTWMGSRDGMEWE